MAVLALNTLTRDLSIQQRAGGISSARVREYAKAMREGAHFPPVVVYFDGSTYWLADGFHRCAAAEDTSRSEIEAEMHSGSRREALLYAAGANAAHGLRRTNADKRKAVLTLLQDEEWRVWSDHELARRSRTTQPFVSKLRRELTSGQASPLRKGVDGRTMNTRNIGRSATLKRLRQAWEQASEGERRQWLEEHRTEIEMYFGASVFQSKPTKNI